MEQITHKEFIEKWKPNSTHIDIQQGYEWRRYFGECKSINEFRKLEKWLNIK